VTRRDVGRSKCRWVILRIEYEIWLNVKSRGITALVNSVLTSNGCLIARKRVEPLKMGMQKTVNNTGALIGDDARKWNSIDWDHVRCQVRRLQVRIAKAVKEGRWNRVKALQYLLTRSLYAKLMAVKRVTSNQGRKTPGVDGVLWRGARAKWQAAVSLQRRGYKPQPLKRIYIPKRNGKKRPLSIPTMSDRAMQAVHNLALVPIAETTADRNSYGFREGRSCADAVDAAFKDLAQPNSATWVLEGDIKGCFDNISHKWLLENIPMDKEILRKWLEAGYMEDGIKYPMRKGTPQGGIASPTLANMTLDGLEETVHRAVPWRSRVNFVRYADDFIVTGKSKRLLEENVIPAVERFLAERGLVLSQEKTVVTHIRDGFTFLGQTFRKHGRVLHITPSKEGVLALMEKVGTTIRCHVSSPMPVLIKKLNEQLRGWGNYHRHVVASRTFRHIDKYVFDQLWRMLRRRHPKKSSKWLVSQYWSVAGKMGVFAVRSRTAKSRTAIYQVQRLCDLGIRRYVKIRAEANPYLPEYAAYFWKRRHFKESKLRRKRLGK
jgi:RNA-directed DNA polymerase